MVPSHRQPTASSDPLAAAWDDLADAELEHDSRHAQHAVDELTRLGALLPAPRLPSADELFDAGHAAVGEIRALVSGLHDRAAQSPDREAHLRAVADVVNACGTQLWRDLVEGVPPALLAAFRTADLPHCLGCDGTCTC